MTRFSQTEECAAPPRLPRSDRRVLRAERRFHDRRVSHLCRGNVKTPARLNAARRHRISPQCLADWRDLVLVYVPRSRCATLDALPGARR